MNSAIVLKAITKIRFQLALLAIRFMKTARQAC